MSFYFDSTGYAHFVSSSVSMSDTHGGREWQHKREMEEIANEIIDKKIELALQGIEKTLEGSIKEMINSKLEELAAAYWKGQKIEADVTAQVAIDTAGKIFQSREVKQFISNAIYDEVKKQLGGNGFHIR